MFLQQELEIMRPAQPDDVDPWHIFFHQLSAKAEAVEYLHLSRDVHILVAKHRESEGRTDNVMSQTDQLFQNVVASGKTSPQQSVWNPVVNVQDSQVRGLDGDACGKHVRSIGRIV